MRHELENCRTYVVNLRRREDRRRHMEKQLPEGLPAVFTSDLDGPFDGLDLDLEKVQRAGCGLFDWPLPEGSTGNPYWERNLTYGEIGCTLSHLACWEHAMTTSASVFLILEDDVTIPPRFTERLASGLAEITSRHPDTGLVYLLRRPLGTDQELFPGVVAPGFSYWTCGYVLIREAAHLILEADVRRSLVPVDEFLPAMYTDHPRKDVRRRFPRRISAAAFEPPLIGKLPKEVVGSDTRDSPLAAKQQLDSNRHV
jgi:glycosyl transferase family 25